MQSQERKIRLKITYGDDSLTVLVKKTQKLEKTMRYVCSKCKQQRNSSRFYHNNKQLIGDETPQSANLVDNDCITMLADTSVDLSHFEVIKVLGKGGYGTVYLVQKHGGRDDGKLYAMKALNKSVIVKDAKSVENTKSEREVLEAFGHSPFLTSMYYAFETESNLYIVLDYVNGGELFTHLCRQEYFTEDEVRIFIAEIVVGIERLHKLGIVYRDIKLENILLDSDGHIAITDFGLSKMLTKSLGRSHSICGTIEYMAPEMVRGGKNGHDLAVDWWSVGVLCFELLTGTSPFTAEDDNGDSRHVLSKRIKYTNPNIPKRIGKAARDLITRLLIKDPSKRLGSGAMGADQIKGHRFFNGIDWDKVAKREIVPAFKPKIQHELDTSNFDSDFTDMPLDIKPLSEPFAYEDRKFRGFSYVAPDLSDYHYGSTALSTSPTIKEVIEYNQMYRSFTRHYTFVGDQPIGNGTFSICMKCIRNDTKHEYAVKILRSKQNVDVEIEALTQFQGHPNIVNIVDVIRDELFSYIVTEWLAGQELFEYVQKEPLCEHEARRIFKKILYAVSHMHRHNTAHRDLKMENIKFTGESARKSNIKILDLGFACKQSSGQKMTGAYYSLDYAAPEILSGMEYTKSCDLWSLGVILYASLCGRMPFRRWQDDMDDLPSLNSDEQITNRIKHGSIDLQNERWSLLSDSVKDLIRRFLTVSPEQRIQLHDVFAHDWLQSQVNNDHEQNGIAQSTKKRTVCDINVDENFNKHSPKRFKV